MIRFLIDQFRNAPGPLKKPRILTADLAEEVLDLAKHYLGNNDSSTETPCCGSVPPPPSPPEPVVETVTPTAPAAEKATKAKKPSVDTSSEEIDPRLASAVASPGNAKKQAFKVLAILWDANDKKLGALSAKAISKHGEEILNLKIRHENVRKVIRMRLENYVNVHAQGVGNGTVYNYEMSDAGLEYFASTYFN